MLYRWWIHIRKIRYLLWIAGVVASVAALSYPPFAINIMAIVGFFGFGLSLACALSKPPKGLAKVGGLAALVPIALVVAGYLLYGDSTDVDVIQSLENQYKLSWLCSLLMLLAACIGYDYEWKARRADLEYDEYE